MQRAPSPCILVQLGQIAFESRDLRLQMLVLRQLAHQEPCRHRAALSDPGRGQLISIAALAGRLAKILQLEPALLCHRLKAVINPPQTYPEPLCEFALREPWLLLKQVQQIAVEAFARGELRPRIGGIGRGQGNRNQSTKLPHSKRRSVEVNFCEINDPVPRSELNNARACSSWQVLRFTICSSNGAVRFAFVRPARCGLHAPCQAAARLARGSETFISPESRCNNTVTRSRAPPLASVPHRSSNGPPTIRIPSPG